MTAIEKAREILDKYRTFVVMWTGGVEVENANVKQCALIAVDEILNIPYASIEFKQYWQQVKEEINKLCK